MLQNQITLILFNFVYERLSTTVTGIYAGTFEIKKGPNAPSFSASKDLRQPQIDSRRVVRAAVASFSDLLSLQLPRNLHLKGDGIIVYSLYIVAVGQIRRSEAVPDGRLHPLPSGGPHGTPRPQPRQARPSPPRSPRRLLSPHSWIRPAPGRRFVSSDGSTVICWFWIRRLLFCDLYFWFREERSRPDTARTMRSSLGFAFFRSVWYLWIDGGFL